MSSSQLRNLSNGWKRKKNAIEEGGIIHGHLSETGIPLAELESEVYCDINQLLLDLITLPYRFLPTCK